MSQFNFHDKVIIKNKGDVHLGDNNNYFADFQGELTNLASALKQGGYEEDSAYVESIYEAVEVMEKLINESGSPESAEVPLRKKGILSKLKGFYEDMTEENSDLYKKTKALRNGAKIVNNLIEFSNNIAKFVPYLPLPPQS
ncbi:MAG: hypothetical protein FWE05_01085 [Defluviitaleaceae bacterium]|nr:hypothetical protein [Defluviitaleaceae bacterium]